MSWRPARGMRQENQRAAVVSKYKDALKEAEEERRQMNAIAREGRQTVQKIAANVQGLYFKLRCRQLEAAVDGGATHGSSGGEGGNGSSCNKTTAPHNTQRRPQLSFVDRKLTIATGKEISERNILHHMELIEKRTCEIIASYAKRLASSSKTKAQRRPSVIMVSILIARGHFILDVKHVVGKSLCFATNLLRLVSFCFPAVSQIIPVPNEESSCTRKGRRQRNGCCQQ